MCLLFETIRIANGEVSNLLFHQQRVDKSSVVNLLEYINSHVPTPPLGIYKLRIVYSRSQIHHHNIEEYNQKKVDTLKIIVDNNIDYHKKFCDRTHLDELMLHRGECSDILIVKNRVLTDISFANITFFDGSQWVTPKKPLLEGSCRARLISHNKIIPKDLTYNDLKSLSHFMIINAMLDFDIKRAVKYSISEDIISICASAKYTKI